MTRNDTAQALEGLRGDATRLAEQLVEFETSPELALLRDVSGLRGRSAELASAAVSGAMELWVKYPLLQGALEQLETAVRHHDDAAAAPLLGQARELATTLTANLATAKQTVAEIAGRWREILPRLDELRVEIGELDHDADDLGLGEDPDLLHARKVVDHLMETIADDPLGTDTTPAERAVERARERIRKLERMRANLPSDLDDADATLEEIDRLITEGRDALHAATSKIVGPHALLEPLDATTLDRDERALRPWLARLRTLAGRGEWRPAATGLEQWRVVANGLLANARAVVDANRAPIVRRDELRGLLDAYRAKAAARGRAEDTVLAAAARAAREALFTAPCDLSAAAALVKKYGDAVNASISAGNA